jgi:CDP-glucose 4,6-dehydratase
VLDSLSGYLLLGQKLLEGQTKHAEAYNFGPAHESSLTVGQLVQAFKSLWDAMAYEFKSDNDQPHEAGLLRLDCSKANIVLNWQPVWDAGQALKKTTLWYKNYYTDNNILTRQDFEDYIHAARRNQVCWIKAKNKGD